MNLVPCTACKHPVAADVQTCPQCGSKQPEYHFAHGLIDYVQCQKCRTKNDRTALFCRACGKVLEEEQRRRREQETDMVCKVAGGILTGVAGLFLGPTLSPFNLNVPGFTGLFRWCMLIATFFAVGYYAVAVGILCVKRRRQDATRLDGAAWFVLFAIGVAFGVHWGAILGGLLLTAPVVGLYYLVFDDPW